MSQAPAGELSDQDYEFWVLQQATEGMRRKRQRNGNGTRMETHSVNVARDFLRAFPRVRLHQPIEPLIQGHIQNWLFQRSSHARMGQHILETLRGLRVDPTCHTALRSPFANAVYDSLYAKTNALCRQKQQPVITHKECFRTNLYHLAKLRGFVRVPTPTEVFTLGAGLSLDEAITYCLQTRYARLALLFTLGFTGSEAAVQEGKSERLALREDFKKWRQSRRLSFDQYFAIYKRLPPDLDSLTLAEAQKWLQQFTQHRVRVFQVLAHALAGVDRQNLIHRLELTLTRAWTGICNLDRFRSLSEWHASVASTVVGDLTQTAATRTYFHQNKQKGIRQKVGQHLWFLHSYAQNHQQSLPTFFAKCNQEALIECLVDFGKSLAVFNDRVQQERSGHHATSSVQRFLHTLKISLGPKYMPRVNLSSLKADDITRFVPNLREQREDDIRRVYTDEEITRMLRVCKDSRETLIITLLREIGLRQVALRHLKYKHLLDETHSPRVKCSVPEKAGHRRIFIPSANLRAQMKRYGEYFRTTVGEDTLHELYLLNPQTPTKPLSTHGFTYILKNIGHAANITEIVCSAHRFRHTIVGKLIASGNSMEHVGKFMGHRDFRTTSNHYWVPQVETLIEEMKNPFLEEYEAPTAAAEAESATAELQSLKIQEALNVIQMYNALIGSFSRQGKTADELRQKIVGMEGLAERLELIQRSIGGAAGSESPGSFRSEESSGSDKSSIV